MDSLNRVSVIIPTFNSSKTILRTLDSVFNQSCHPHEIIIVDDGSSDNTPTLIQEAYPNLIILIQKNSGAAAARNKGVNASSGNIVAFLDSDDVWHKDKLKFQLEVFDKYPTIDICSTGYQRTLDSQATQADIKNFTQLDQTSKGFQQPAFDLIFLNPFLGTPTVAIKKSTFLSLGGFDSKFKTAEDIDLWLRACYKSNLAILNNELCWVLEQDDSLSRSAKKSPYESHLDVIDNFCMLHPLFEKSKPKLINKVRSRILTNWGSNDLLKKNYSDARKIFMRAFLYKPSARLIYLFLKSLLRY